MASRRRNAPEGVPQYVIDHAPLIYLYSSDPYRPSNPATTLANTRPQINFNDVQYREQPLTLANLNQLNSVGSKDGADIYLTSNVDISTDPTWLEGIQPDEAGGTGDEKTCVIVVADKGKGVVDAFFMPFFALNWGGVVLKKQLGDHVGDWEHNMIRFVNGVPESVWFSQHANGAAYAFSALSKDPSGMRPLVYCANGSHALYPSPGPHDHTLPNLPLPFKVLLVDDTDTGPLYDPLLTSHYYTYNVAASAFTAYDPAATPTGYLNFRGHWGDEEYPAKDKRQQDLLGNKKYVGGPTGPWDKQLGRTDVWPKNQWSFGQRIRRALERRGVLAKVRGPVKRLRSDGGRVKRVKVSGEVVK